MYVAGRKRCLSTGGRGAPPPDASARAAQLSAQRAVQAEQEGYDAFCPFGTLDIGVRAARRFVKIPVVGQAEACFPFCGLLDRPFASCSYMPGGEDRDGPGGDVHLPHRVLGQGAV